MNEFLERLKQRKLVQWGVAYIASAFVLLQGIDIDAGLYRLCYDPLLAGLHDDPRFAAHVKKMGLTE